jgi:hypothetical protein
MMSLVDYLEEYNVIDSHTHVGGVVTARCGPWHLTFTSSDDPNALSGSSLEAVSKEPIAVTIGNKNEMCVHVCHNHFHVASFIRKWRSDAEYRRRLNATQG